MKCARQRKKLADKEHSWKNLNEIKGAEKSKNYIYIKKVKGQYDMQEVGTNIYKQIHYSNIYTKIYICMDNPQE